MTDAGKFQIRMPHFEETNTAERFINFFEEVLRLPEESEQNFALRFFEIIRPVRSSYLEARPILSQIFPPEQLEADIETALFEQFKSELSHLNVAENILNSKEFALQISNLARLIANISDYDLQIFLLNIVKIYGIKPVNVFRAFVGKTLPVLLRTNRADRPILTINAEEDAEEAAQEVAEVIMDESKLREIFNEN